MINGLTDYKKFKVIRPLAENHIYDEYGMPVIQATSESMIDIVKAKPVNIKNLTCKNSVSVNQSTDGIREPHEVG